MRWMNKLFEEQKHMEFVYKSADWFSFARPSMSLFLVVKKSS